MERTLRQVITKISKEEYSFMLEQANHVFLVGDLQQPCPHPFIRDQRFELIVCNYQKNDNGRYHWHEVVNEYEWVVEGEVGFFEVGIGHLHWFLSGDLLVIPAGICVQRRVRQPARTITIKVPSNNEKIHCAQCIRPCSYRMEPYRGK
jgi:hypothetical protein